MKIVVCVKQVLDTAAKIRIKEGRVDAEGVPRILNPYDEFAVEEALLLRDKFPGSEITLITLGPESSRDALKTGLAMGADKAIHLHDPVFNELDNQGVARVLAQSIGATSFDLVLCGRQAVDDDMAGVGPALAMSLNIPLVSVVTQLKISDARVATITRQIEGGSETIEAPLPVLVTCQKGLNVPRLPSLKGIMAAKKKEVSVLDAKTVGFDPQHPDSANRVRQVDLSLPPARKKGRILAGSPEETARELVKILREEEKVV